MNAKLVALLARQHALQQAVETEQQEILGMADKLWRKAQREAGKVKFDIIKVGGWRCPVCDCVAGPPLGTHKCTATRAQAHRAKLGGPASAQTGAYPRERAWCTTQGLACGAKQMGMCFEDAHSDGWLPYIAFNNTPRLLASMNANHVGTTRMSAASAWTHSKPMIFRHTRTCCGSRART